MVSMTICTLCKNCHSFFYLKDKLCILTQIIMFTDSQKILSFFYECFFSDNSLSVFKMSYYVTKSTNE